MRVPATTVQMRDCEWNLHILFVQPRSRLRLCKHPIAVLCFAVSPVVILC